MSRTEKETHLLDFAIWLVKRSNNAIYLDLVKEYLNDSANIKDSN